MGLGDCPHQSFRFLRFIANGPRSFAACAMTSGAAARGVFIMQAPPTIGRAPLDALRRILPILLPPERRQIEEGPDAAQHLDAAPAGEIGTKQAVGATEENVKAKAAIHAEVGVEIIEGRIPRHRPAHALFEFLDIGDRGARHKRKRSIAGMQMGEMADLIGEQAATRARMFIGRLQHVMIDDDLAAAVEQFGEAEPTAWRIENVILVDPFPAKPAAFGGQRIKGARPRLFLDEQRRALLMPLLARNDAWRMHGLCSLCWRPALSQSLSGSRSSQSDASGPRASLAGSDAPGRAPWLRPRACRQAGNRGED